MARPRFVGPRPLRALPPQPGQVTQRVWILSPQFGHAFVHAFCGNQIHGHGGTGINNAQRPLVVGMRRQHGKPTVYAHTLRLSVTTHQTKTG